MSLCVSGKWQGISLITRLAQRHEPITVRPTLRVGIRNPLLIRSKQNFTLPIPSPHNLLTAITMPCFKL